MRNTEKKFTDLVAEAYRKTEAYKAERALVGMSPRQRSQYILKHNICILEAHRRKLIAELTANEQ